MCYIETMDPDESSDSNETIETKTSTSPFRIEWSLFWGGLLGDHDKTSGEDPLKALTRDQVSKLIKDLSAQRKKLHKEIESVNKEMEIHTSKLESLALVGGNLEETEARLNQLSDMGQALSSELHTLNQKLKWVRSHEKELTTKDLA